MRAHSAIRKVRFTVRIRTDIKAALEELQAKRDREFSEVDIADLLHEGALLLLRKEGIPVNGNSSEPLPPRKLPKAVTRRRKAGAA